MRSADGPLVHLAYGPAATVWRMNLGWRRSQQRDGFDLDIERGSILGVIGPSGSRES